MRTGNRVVWTDSWGHPENRPPRVRPSAPCGVRRRKPSPGSHRFTGEITAK